jgi:hypothetical protein
MVWSSHGLKVGLNSIPTNILEDREDEVIIEILLEEPVKVTLIMTRINACINPLVLCDQHLLAEHREIKRIPNVIRSGKAKLTGIPTKFSLGKGHVKFFYNKLGYLQNRYAHLHQECLARGFNVTDYSDCFIGFDDSLYGFLDFDPSIKSILQSRIVERLKTMKSIKFKSDSITANGAIKILLQ